MFALLEHRIGESVHWDFLLELPDSESLTAWRLAECPLAADAEIAAERIGPHRRVYLDFEGEISGGRGRVRRLDRGDAELLSDEAGAWRFRLLGTRLAGTFEITASPDPRFRRYRPAGQGAV